MCRTATARKGGTCLHDFCKPLCKPICWDSHCCVWLNHSYYTLLWDMLIVALTLLHGYCAAQHADQLMPVHQRLCDHPQGTAPHVLDMILRRASLRAGRSPKGTALKPGACSGAPRRNVLMMACKIIQCYQISAKSDHRSCRTQRCLENRCSS